MQFNMTLTIRFLAVHVLVNYKPKL